MKRSHRIPLLVFIVLFGLLFWLAWASFVLGPPISSRRILLAAQRFITDPLDPQTSALSLSGIAWRKAKNCFVHPLGLPAAMLLTAACLGWGWRTGKQTLSDMTPIKVWLLLPILCGISIAIGWQTFRVASFTHGMLHWPWYGFAQLALGNLGRALLASSLALLVTRPWRHVPRADLRKLDAAALGLALLNYLIAFMAYVSFQRFEME